MKHTFTLIGAEQFNAILEDEKTGTLWFQTTGEAAAGPLMGSHLEQVKFEMIRINT